MAKAAYAIVSLNGAVNPDGKEKISDLVLIAEGT